MVKCLKSCHILLLSKSRLIGPDEWERSKVKGWIEVDAGVLAPSLSDKTTHVVCDEIVWNSKGEELQEALAAVASGRKLYIVKLEWLTSTLYEHKKAKEKEFLWDDKSNFKPFQRSRKKDKDDDDSDAVETMEDVLHEGTKNHVIEQDLAQMKKMFADEDSTFQQAEQERKARESLLRANEARRKKELALLVQRGAHKARNQQFGENHHIYRSGSGFPYEITLTKVDIPNNCNKREVLTLQIYESNAEPHTYAVNMHSASSASAPANTILASLGTNYATAYRYFRQAFLELTKVHWDDRFEKFETGSPHLAKIQDVSYDLRPFTYHLPTYGPDDRSVELSSTNTTEVQLEIKPEPVDSDESSFWATQSTSDHIGSDRATPNLGRNLLGAKRQSNIRPTQINGRIVDVVDLD